MIRKGWDIMWSSRKINGRWLGFSVILAGLIIVVGGATALAQTLNNGEVKVNGHLDVRAVEGNVAVGNNDFQIGQFVLGLSSAVNHKIDAHMEVAYASEAREVAVDEAYIKWRVYEWDGQPKADDPLQFRETGFVVGQFDVPFGIDWRSYSSINRPLVSLPLVVTNMHKGWNDLGAQFYAKTTWSTLSVFAVNGFGTSPALRVDEVNRLPEPLIAADVEADQNFLPTEAYGARFGLFMSEFVEFGTSFAAGYMDDNTQQSRMFGVDASFNFEQVELRGEFISRRRMQTSGQYMDLGYYVQSLYRQGRLFGVVRADAYRPDEGATYFCGSGGAGYQVFDNAQLRAEYRLAEGSSNDTVYLQSVIAF
ncbi:MAG: hypothetical protein Kow0074_13800 [Candidatus Zixiibacteriota bacterium]